MQPTTETATAYVQKFGNLYGAPTTIESAKKWVLANTYMPGMTGAQISQQAQNIMSNLATNQSFLSGATTENKITQATPTAYDAQAAAQAAAEKAKKTGLRSTIGNLIGSAMDIYKNLYGGLEKQAAAQKGQLETQFGQGLGEVGKQFTTELPKIGQAYAARGAYDSTWRAGAEQTAADAYAKQLADLYKSQQESLGKIGSAYQTEKAKYGVGETALRNIQSRLADVTDLNELTALRNSIESKIGELQTAQAGMGTEAQNVAATQALQGMSDKFAQASKTIQTIVQGQAPAMLKKSIAENIIINSDLTDPEKKQLQDVVNTQVA